MDDYISRQETLNQFEDMTIDIFESEVRERISEIPAADVQPVRHGKWERCYYKHGAVWKCSLCGEITDDTVMGIPRFLYCPMCGARMDGA